jgi:hypothetical protein
VHFISSSFQPTPGGHNECELDNISYGKITESKMIILVCELLQASSAPLFACF